MLVIITQPMVQLQYVKGILYTFLILLHDEYFTSFCVFCSKDLLLFIIIEGLWNHLAA